MSPLATSGLVTLLLLCALRAIRRTLLFLPGCEGLKGDEVTQPLSISGNWWLSQHWN